MKSRVNRLLIIAGVPLFFAAMLSVHAQEATKKAVLRAAPELKWVDAQGATGVQQATAWGNAQKGAHGSFAKFAGGTEVPLHTHTASGRSVVISGTLLEGLEGQKPKELGAGSYFSIPGDVKHTTACKAGADCVIYSEWSGAFDLKPATP
jgi:quercetin dioxygenase-like cupin family protein